MVLRRVGGIHHGLKHPPAQCIVLHPRPGAHRQARLVDRKHEGGQHCHGCERQEPASVGAHGSGRQYDSEDPRIRQRDAVEQVVRPGVPQTRARHRHEHAEEAPDPDEGADAAPQEEKLTLALAGERVEEPERAAEVVDRDHHVERDVQEARPGDLAQEREVGGAVQDGGNGERGGGPGRDGRGPVDLQGEPERASAPDDSAAAEDMERDDDDAGAVDVVASRRVGAGEESLASSQEDVARVHCEDCPQEDGEVHMRLLGTHRARRSLPSPIQQTAAAGVYPARFSTTVIPGWCCWRFNPLYN
jgi:hypothetical protein